jgi:Na+/phosphate symporter
MDMATIIDGPDGFVTSSAQMQAYAVRTSRFLHLIETTVASVVANTEMLQALAREAHKTLDLLRTVTVERHEPIDPAGHVSAQLRRGAESALNIYNDAIGRYRSAAGDKQLREEDGVADSFKQLIEAAADLHNVVEDLRDTVECIDASQEPSVGATFTSVDELIADILK